MNIATLSTEIISAKVVWMKTEKAWNRLLVRKGNEVMWKLIITQERKSEYVDGTISEKVEFTGKDINVLTLIVAKLSEHENGVDTSYKLEKVGE